MASFHRQEYSEKPKFKSLAGIQERLLAIFVSVITDPFNTNLPLELERLNNQTD